MTVHEERIVGGRYRLERQIGRGGMGRVWQGRDTMLDRPVAIKEVLLPEGIEAGERNELTARAMREAQAAARLQHDGIVTVHDVVREEATPWIVMELVSGSSLQQLLTNDGRQPWRRVTEIGLAAAQALAHAHAAGVVHRDLKPDNVLLAGPRVVITDFGIARVLDATTQLTHTGTIMGTPQYMAPEQLEGQRVNAAADIWALGATLYAAVAGRPPFDGETLTAVFTAILTKPVPPAPQPQAGPLWPLLETLLRKDPAERPTADSVAEELARLLRPGPAAAAPATPPPATAAPERPRAVAAAAPALTHPATERDTPHRPAAVPPTPQSPVRPATLIGAWLVALAAGGALISFPHNLPEFGDVVSLPLVSVAAASGMILTKGRRGRGAAFSVLLVLLAVLLLDSVNLLDAQGFLPVVNLLLVTAGNSVALAQLRRAWVPGALFRIGTLMHSVDVGALAVCAAGALAALYGWVLYLSDFTPFVALKVEFGILIVTVATFKLRGVAPALAAEPRGAQI